MEDQLQRQANDERFAARVSIRYHKHRVAFFEAVDRFVNFVSLVLSSAAVVAIIGTDDSLGQKLAAMVAILQAVALVFQPSRKARVHSDLAVRHAEIERLVVACQTHSELARAKSLRSEVEQDEPPVRWWLGLLAHNEVLLSEYGHDAFLYEIPVMQRFGISQWVDWCRKRAVKQVNQSKIASDKPSASLPAE